MKNKTASCLTGRQLRRPNFFLKLSEKEEDESLKEKGTGSAMSRGATITPPDQEKEKREKNLSGWEKKKKSFRMEKKKN